MLDPNYKDLQLFEPMYWDLGFIRFAVGVKITQEKQAWDRWADYLLLTTVLMKEQKPCPLSQDDLEIIARAMENSYHNSSAAFQLRQPTTSVVDIHDLVSQIFKQVLKKTRSKK